MYYLLERSPDTGEFVTNFTMYDTSPESLVNRLWPDGLYYRVGHGDDPVDMNFPWACSTMYRHINTGKEIGVIFSAF